MLLACGRGRTGRCLHLIVVSEVLYLHGPGTWGVSIQHGNGTDLLLFLPIKLVCSLSAPFLFTEEAFFPCFVMAWQYRTCSKCTDESRPGIIARPECKLPCISAQFPCSFTEISNMIAVGMFTSHWPFTLLTLASRVASIWYSSVSHSYCGLTGLATSGYDVVSENTTDLTSVVIRGQIGSGTFPHSGLS